MSSIYSKAERYKLFLRFLYRKYKPVCCFCKKPLDWRTFFRNMNGKQLDDNVIHHKDGDHYNDDIDNQDLGHRKCHLEYHRQKELREQRERVEKVLQENII